MKSRQSLLWLGAPALVAAMMTQAAPGDQMPMQNQQMHQEKMQQMTQEQQQMSNADLQKCAEMHGMDSSKMNMNDPHVQQMMQKCMQMMHEGKMMGGGMMQGDGMHGGQQQGGQMQGGKMMGNDN